MTRKDDTLELIPAPGDWAVNGLCTDLGADTEYDWFPEDDLQTEQSIRAQQVCSLCPVRVECANYAIKHKIPHGIWGGLTETQRGYPPPTSRVRDRNKGAQSGSRASCPKCKKRSGVVPRGKTKLECVKCKVKWPAPTK